MVFGLDVDRITVSIGLLFIFGFLVFVRRIEIFASTHIFADILIAVTVIVIMIYGAMKLKDRGSMLSTVPFFNTVSYADAIGFSVYGYEGIGMIMPVQDITANPESYHKIVYAVIGVTCTMFVVFGQFCVVAWGSDMVTPLITDNLPDGIISYVVLGLFCINLFFSYPLQLYPVNVIVDNIFFSDWEKTPKRQFSKNTTRSITVGLSVVATILLGDKLDKFLSILGAIACTPIAFLFPALFHYKVSAKTQKQKTIDMVILIFAVSAMGYCTTMGILGWAGDEDVMKLKYANFNPNKPPTPTTLA